MIRFRQVTKSYATQVGRQYLFKNLSFELPEDEHIGIVGPMGVGKSTLLRLISGVINPDQGKIETQGRASWPVGLKTKVSGQRTGREHATAFGHWHGLRGKFLIRFLRRVADFAELGDAMHRSMSEYTPEMVDRLAFAMNMAFTFNYYLIDGPMAVGDAAFQQKCMAAWDEKARHSQLLIVSNDPSTLGRYCTKGVLVGRDGLEIHDSVASALEQFRRQLH